MTLIMSPGAMSPQTLSLVERVRRNRRIRRFFRHRVAVGVLGIGNQTSAEGVRARHTGFERWTIRC